MKLTPGSRKATRDGFFAQNKKTDGPGRIRTGDHPIPNPVPYHSYIAKVLISAITITIYTCIYFSFRQVHLPLRRHLLHVMYKHSSHRLVCADALDDLELYRPHMTFYLLLKVLREPQYRA